jgi:hypothetical protein
MTTVHVWELMGGHYEDGTAVRRCVVPGGWLYQAQGQRYWTTTHDTVQGRWMWSWTTPVFVPAHR